MINVVRTISFLSWLCAPAALTAQTVQGIVLEASSGEAVGGVELVLIGSKGHVAKVGVSGADGLFTIAAEHTGRYRLRTSRIGYETTTTAEFDLLTGDTMEVELVVGVAAVAVDPLRVVSKRQPLVLDRQLERVGFYERRDVYGERSGFAAFLDYPEIRAMRAFDVTDLLRASPRIRIIHKGGREVEPRGPSRCRPSYLLNGNRLRLRGEPLNVVVNAAEIVALEIYMSGVGPWGNCVIAIWTGYHAAMADEGGGG